MDELAKEKIKEAAFALEILLKAYHAEFNKKEFDKLIEVSEMLEDKIIGAQ